MSLGTLVTHCPVLCFLPVMSSASLPHAPTSMIRQACGIMWLTGWTNPMRLWAPEPFPPCQSRVRYFVRLLGKLTLSPNVSVVNIEEWDLGVFIVVFFSKTFYQLVNLFASDLSGSTPAVCILSVSYSFTLCQRCCSDFIVNLMQHRVIYTEGASAEKLPQWARSLGTSVAHCLDC